MYKIVHLGFWKRREAGMTDSNPTWRAGQKAAFGDRLKLARKRMKGPGGKPLYPSAADFIAALTQRYPDTQRRTYYQYESGRSMPKHPDAINRLAEMLGVTRDWLLFGKGEQVNDDALTTNVATINQAIEIPLRKSLKPPPLRYIPVLTASDLKNMLLGNGRRATMSREQLPVSQHIDAGAEAFYYRIPDDDTSMVGSAGHSFPPGTLLLIDPGRIIRPADFLLAQPADAPAPIMRRLQARLPFDPGGLVLRAYPFRLVALNPMAEPIEVNDKADCHIIGRVVSFTQIL
jgi:SOS-response transcriptional repressor LexA